MKLTQTIFWQTDCKSVNPVQEEKKKIFMPLKLLASRSMVLCVKLDIPVVELTSKSFILGEA